MLRLDRNVFTYPSDDDADAAAQLQSFVSKCLYSSIAIACSGLPPLSCDAFGPPLYKKDAPLSDSPQAGDNKSPSRIRISTR